MRKLLLLALVAGLTGCQTFDNMFTGRKHQPAPVAVAAPGPVAGCPDPLLSSDLEEQQRYGRSRYAYPENDRNLVPPMIQDRPSPSGR
jgi:hypothetical protein